MARDKLITIRIEGEKREAFNQLAKSHNTDTASLLYDFINQCLSGQIDIALVTGKGNRIDKIDNQLDSDRIDILETATQRIDNRIDTIAKKLTDSDQGLSEKITSLEHRLNALAIQLDSQKDSQLDSQQKTPDMEPVPTVETADNVESGSEPALEAIETVPKTHKDIAKRLEFKSQTKLNYWISTGKIPAEYADRCQFNPEKTKILWITP